MNSTIDNANMLPFEAGSKSGLSDFGRSLLQYAGIVFLNAVGLLLLDMALQSPVTVAVTAVSIFGTGLTLVSLYYLRRKGPRDAHILMAEKQARYVKERMMTAGKPFPEVHVELQVNSETSSEISPEVLRMIAQDLERAVFTRIMKEQASKEESATKQKATETN